jgi:outer membrane protein OmpA-like peptidoglycan-associated protein
LRALAVDNSRCTAGNRITVKQAESRNERAWWRWRNGCVLWFAALPAFALDFAPALSQAEWHLQRSPLECRLSQPIPDFGEAVFRQAAGAPAQFTLSSTHRLLPGIARLRAESPPWRDPIKPQLLGHLTVRPGPTPVQVEEERAERILGVLLEGLIPVIDEFTALVAGGPSSVRLLAVNFRAAYRDYRECVGTLLPSSFSQAARTRLSYASGGYELDATARDRLDVLVRHVELAGDVKAVYVDGYTDDTGRRQANLELSRARAEAVTDYLVKQGVPAEIITTRYHGSRFPVAMGRSSAARAENRRVTVRLERG